MVVHVLGNWEVVGQTLARKKSKHFFMPREWI